MKRSEMTRRRFISLSAAMAAGVASGVPRAAARTPGSNDRIRLGMIGMGRRGMQLLHEVLAKSAALNVDVAAVCDIFEPRELQARHTAGADLHHRWQELVLRPDIDAVVIATPDHWHASMAIAAMEAGKDVYCEKPMAHSIEEAKAFRDTAAATKRVVQIGAQTASEPQWHAARDVVASGRLGTVLWSQENYRYHEASGGQRPALHGASPENLDWGAFQGASEKRGFTHERYFEWRKYWDYGGGIATDLHYQKLAGLMVALGAEFPLRVSAAGGVYAQDGREVPDSFVTTCEFSRSGTVVLASSGACTGDLPAVIRGEEATLYIADNSVCVESEHEYREQFQGRFGSETRAAIPVPTREGHFENWIRCLRSREQCVCNEAVSYKTMVAIGMSVEAYRQGRTLYFDPVAEQVALRPVLREIV